MENEATAPKEVTYEERVSAVILDIGGAVEKDRENTFSKYRYASADSIIEIAGQATAKQCIIVEPEIVEHSIVATQYGDSKVRYDATIVWSMEIRWPGGSKTKRWVSAGSDTTAPEKALYKAMTSGDAYFLKRYFKIGASNEDGEHEPREEMTLPSASAVHSESQRQSTVAEQVKAKVVASGKYRPDPNVVPPYVKGELAGKTWADLNADQLAAFRKRLEDDVKKQDPTWHGTNVARLAAINQEIQRRAQ